MGRRTTIEQRELVINKFKNGKSVRQIGEIVNLSASTVQHIIERYLHENRVESKGRSAPNKIFSASEERYIVRKINVNSKLSVPKLVVDLQQELGKTCSSETIRRVLREHNFNGRVARKQPFISKK